jgi:ferrous iron transport protein B
MEIVLAGRPNSGKSTLFNQIAGARQKVGNYAGCTVEKKSSSVQWDGRDYIVTDLPGMYTLEANSIDEQVAIRHLEEVRESGFVVFVIDGNNLMQELPLPLLLKKKGYRIAIAVNMMDEVKANRKILDLAGMQDLTDIPFFGISAKTGEGVGALKKFLCQSALVTGAARAATLASGDVLTLYKDAKLAVKRIAPFVKGPQEDILLKRDSAIDRYLLNKFFGPVVFLSVMFVMFQSIFSWAAPLSDFVESGIGLLQEAVKTGITHELTASLLSDGVLAGVGAVVVFVPQIAILFFLIGLLEYSGYLPRIAYMVDRLMKPYGLDGKVFIPLLSSVACAVPGIMATRNIESERTRILAIMISPLMTCSARLPVYTLLISTFVPAVAVGPFQLQGLVMFSMFVLAIVMALTVAFVLHRLNFSQSKHVIDLLHLPHYRSPNWQELLRFVWLKVFSFLKKAGTIIAAMAILLWALLTFPNSHHSHAELMQKIHSAEGNEEQALLLEQQHSSLHLEESYAGKLGHWMAPVFAPLGYDWKLTIGILASLAAREVFVSTIGTVFALGEVDESSESLAGTLKDAKDANGNPAYTLATCLSLLVFFAFSLQCISTIGVAKREANSWKIPALMFGYMFALAYGSAFLVFQVTTYLLA